MLCSLSSSTTMMADPIAFTSIRIDISVELKKKINVWTVSVINVINVINVIHRCYQCLICVINSKTIFQGNGIGVIEFMK